MKFFGLLFAIVAIIASYALAGGNIALLFQPVEIAIILGAGLGSFFMSNNLNTIKMFFSNLPLYFQNSHFGHHIYEDTIACIRQLNKVRLTKGMKVVGDHVDDPETSSIFQQYPHLYKDKENLHFVANIYLYKTLQQTGSSTQEEINKLEQKQIDNNYKNAITLANAIHNLAESMPGFGIIAAILGVTLALAGINEGNSYIAQALTAALIGTASGLFFGYGVFGPFSTSMRDYANAQKEFQCFCLELINLSGNIKNDYIFSLASIKAMPVEIKAKLRKTLLEEALA